MMASDMAGAKTAMARQDWTGALNALVPLMGTHERFGGSRAQRDLLELALLTALLRQGRAEEARHITALRRPVLMRAVA